MDLERVADEVWLVRNPEGRLIGSVFRVVWPRPPLPAAWAIDPTPSLFFSWYNCCGDLETRFPDRDEAIASLRRNAGRLIPKYLSNKSLETFGRRSLTHQLPDSEGFS